MPLFGKKNPASSGSKPAGPTPTAATPEPAAKKTPTVEDKYILKDVLGTWVNHGQSSYWTAKSSFFFLTSDHTEAENLGPKLHPGGGFFGPWFFIILKNSHQDLSNKGSNFILSSLEVGDWVAQTWPFFDKLLEMADFGLLQQSQNRARFWIC